MKIQISASHEYHRVVRDWGYTVLAHHDWWVWDVRLVDVEPAYPDFDVLVGTFPSWREALRAGWIAYRFAQSRPK